MILENVELNIRAGESTAFEAAFATAADVIGRAEGFEYIELHRDLEEPTRYAMLIGWRSVDDHVHGFHGSPAFDEWRALLHHFYAASPAGRQYEPVLLASARRT